MMSMLQHTPITLTPMRYVCVVSQYNLPSLEACLARKPSEVSLIITGSFEKAGKRLRRELEKLLPGIEVHELRGSLAHPLEGEEVISTLDWGINVLGPHLTATRREDLPIVLNFTGGTKAMSLALLHAIEWHELDYKANGRSELQVLQFRQGNLKEKARLPLEDVAPIHIAHLHEDDVHETPNAIVSTPDNASENLALRFWRAQADADPNLGHLFATLEKVWVIESDDSRWQRRHITLPWSEFDSSRESLTPWLESLQHLAPEELRWDSSGVTLPGNKVKGKARSLRDWISGIWLEEVAYLWLLNAGIPPGQIARNLRSGPSSTQSASQREADLLIHWRQKTYLIEVKAGLPPGHAPSELETQLSSLVDRFGSTQKALFIGPALQRNLQKEHRWEAFQQRCQASRIRMIVDPEDLNSLFVKI